MTTSRIFIHAGTDQNDAGKHPDWRGENDAELQHCSFAEKFEAGEKNIDAREAMTEINKRIEHVLDKAPSDATANLLLRKSGNAYRAFLKVRSKRSKFAGFISGSRLLDVVDRVSKEVRTQIDDWKAHRRIADDQL